MKLSKEQIAYLKSLDSKKKKRKFLLDCLIENVEYESESQELIAKSNEIAKLPTDFCVEITKRNKAVLQMVWNGFHQMDGILNSKYLISNSLHTYCLASNARICKGKKMPIVETEDFLNYIGKENLAYLISEKPNYSPEEIELVKHNINLREICDLPINRFQVDEKGNWNKVPKYSPKINQREVTEQGSELLKFDSLEEQQYIIDFVERFLKNDVAYPHTIITHGLTIHILKDNEIAK